MRTTPAAIHAKPSLNPPNSSPAPLQEGAKEQLSFRPLHLVKTALFTIAVSGAYTLFGAYYVALIQRHAKRWAFTNGRPVSEAPVLVMAAFPVFLASLGPVGVVWGVVSLIFP